MLMTTKPTCFILLLLLTQFNAITCGTRRTSQRPINQERRKLNRVLEDLGPVYSCPTEGYSISVPSGQIVQLEKSNNGQICTLTRIIITADEELPGGASSSIPAPVGRSYDGYDWERVAGPYPYLEYKCDDFYCEVDLPPSNDGEDFQLSTFSSSLPKRDEVARFLEQTTFGTTLKDLDALAANLDEGVDVDLDQNIDLMPRFLDWIHNQIYEVRPTSHRKTFREVTSPRFEDPQREGRQTTPCEIGARWRWYSFTGTDLFRKVRITKIGEYFALSISGKIRTMINKIAFQDGTRFLYRDGQPEEFEICVLDEEIWGRFGIEYKGKCKEFNGGNPPIRIIEMSPRPVHLIPLDNTDISAFEMDKVASNDRVSTLILKKAIDDVSCASIPYPIEQNVYAKLPNGQRLIFEPTLKWIQNYVKNPSEDGGGSVVLATEGLAECANAPRTFLNEHKCVMSDQETACAPYTSIDGDFELSPANLVKMYELKRRPIYAITNLRLEDDYTVNAPCAGDRSRWKLFSSGETCHGDAHSNTVAQVATLIRNAKENSAGIVDLFLSIELHCHPNDVDKKRLYVKVDNQCWKNIHPDNYNVYDFFDWAKLHPGNGEKNLIRKPAKKGSHKLEYPLSHPMARWNINKSNLKYIGRLGDSMPFVDIPARQFLTRDIAESFGVYAPPPEGRNTLVCGSPFEIGNDKLSIPRFLIAQGDNFDDPIERSRLKRQKHAVWAMIALNAEDQLRQRMAWALSQLLVVSPFSAVTLNSESFVAYYDIFVRNAFGNYRDILREVTYSPMMADMLTYYESKSSEYIWNKDGYIQFADENFSREVMQLFTIGLVKLNLDGTPKVDNEGNKIQTYTNDDVTEYARAWTGFTQQSPRGNVEQRNNHRNSIDPMKIEANWHDHFPKMGLDGKYIGDGYILCSDLPSDIFLRRGAKWRLLGKSKVSDIHNLLLSNKAMTGDVTVTVLDSSSSLLRELCRPSDGKCTYPGVVIINELLDCFGVECNLDSVRVVQVEEGIYYEFVDTPCVQFQFFEGGKSISKSRSSSNEDRICANRHLAVAAEACCNNRLVATHKTCKYTGERVPYSIASSRCSQLGKNLCNYNSLPRSKCGSCCNYDGYFWTNDDCQIFAIIDSSGKVAVERTAGATDSYDSLTFFRVQWVDDQYPSPIESCGDGHCEIIGKYCRCGIEVEENRVFTTLPSRREILSRLKIGGLEPWMFDYASENNYGDVTVHASSSDNPYGMRTVFQVEDDFGRTLFLKNADSIVNIGTWKFRNAPSFHSIVPEVCNAQNEIEATLDHLFYHENTAPFLARRFIQRFGVSNPSPGFIERVATAFKTGRSDLLPYSGSGEYGDLAMTVAAIVADQESRNIQLDSDISYGSLREPVLKVTALMRNLDYHQTNGEFASLSGLQKKIGQESHEMPTVFSFFQPDFAPPGGISMSALVSPEAILLPNAIGVMNGLISMIKFGLSSCYGGLANPACKRYTEESGDYRSSIGRLQYLPKDGSTSIDVVNELATLLTSGRLSVANRNIIKSQYSGVEKRDNNATLRIAEQLVMASPEFHTTGKPSIGGTVPTNLTSPRTKSCKKHKAVVHLLLQGGCDSFNLLVPHSECLQNDLYMQYKQARGSVAMPKHNLLEIDASTSIQECQKFGVHSKLPLLKNLYDQGDALFFAGIGVLSKPVTKDDDYIYETKTQLFAHNTLQAEISRLDPYDQSTGTGSLGRLSDALHSKNYSVSAFSIDTPLIALEGALQNGVEKVSVRSMDGFRLLNPSSPNGNVTGTIPLLNRNGGGDSGIFSNTWTSSLHDVVQRNEQLYRAQHSSRLKTNFPDTVVGRQLSLVSKIIKSNECRGADRDLFYIETGKYDHHKDTLAGLDNEFSLLNEALTSFVAEMKDQEKWDDVTIVVSSDFGRTLSPNNGQGTDHGWMGHSYMLGGQVQGGRILGKYPADLSNESPLNVGRGRFIPTLPWEAVWNGVSQWLGISDADALNQILPNRNAFPGQLFEANDLYTLIQTEEQTADCEGNAETVFCIPKYIDDDDNFGNFDDDDNPFRNGIDEAELGEQGNQSRSSSTGAIVGSTFFIIFISVCVVVWVIYKRQGGLLCAYCPGRWSGKRKWINIGEDYDDDATQENSMEIDSAMLAILHLKDNKGVEVAHVSERI